MRRRAWLAGLAGLAVLTTGGVGYLRLADTPSPAAPGAPAMVEVAMPALSETAQAGQAAFSAHCAVCHGAQADGRLGLGPPLIHRIYEPGHHGDMAFRLAPLRGVRAHHWRFGDMPPVPGLQEDEMTAIIAFVREVQRANGIF